jgi:hypothetical protein
VEAILDYASTFTRHLARYTLSGHLIALQRMATESPDLSIAATFAKV